MINSNFNGDDSVFVVIDGYSFGNDTSESVFENNDEDDDDYDSERSDDGFRQWNKVKDNENIFLLCFYFIYKVK